MKFILLLLCTAGLFVACETYDDDYRRTYQPRHAYREGYYYRGSYYDPYVYPRRAGTVYRYDTDGMHPRPYYRGYRYYP